MIDDKKLTHKRCRCRGCGEYFNTVALFDKHRRGKFGVNRQCLTIEEMQSKGWALNSAGFWVGNRSNYVSVLGNFERSQNLHTNG